MLDEKKADADSGDGPRSDVGPLEGVGLLDDSELADLGLHRDEVGRIIDGQGNFICAASGRPHRQYLRCIPWPDLEHGTVRRLWVDSQTLREWGRAMVSDLEEDGLNWAVKIVRSWAATAVSKLAQGWWARLIA